MAKTKSNRRRGGAKQSVNWSNADHDARTAKRIASLNKKRRRRIQSVDDDDPKSGPAARQAEGPERQPPRHDRHERPLHQVRHRKKSLGGNRHRLASHVPDDAYKRSHLAHDNYDQIDSSKLRLATAQVQRRIDSLKDQLERWDPVEEARTLAAKSDKTSIEHKMEVDAKNRCEDRRARQKAEGEYNLLHARHGVNSSTHRRKANLKKRPRPGPESWKLRGAARPAWEVYDFDTRFIDVHAKAQEEANQKARRVRNVFSLCRGRFSELVEEEDNGQEDSINNKNGQRLSPVFLPPQPHCRQYLSLLTQHGSLQLHRKNYSSARKSLLEAIDLEGPAGPHSVTNARNHLMNMYLATNRPSSARKLWTLLENDEGAWIRYSAALIEYVSWNLLHEEGSTSDSAERMLTRAIRGNVYVVYLLGWPDMFEKALEYTDEVVEQGLLDSKSGSMLEAIEYGCCCYSSGRRREDGDDGEEGANGEISEEDRGMGTWLETEGSLDWVRSVVLRVLNKSEEDEERGLKSNDRVGVGADRLLTRADLLSWKSKLSVEEEEYERERTEKEERLRCKDEDENSTEKEGESQDEDPDVIMYAGMFRTAMDWLQDAGEFLKEPSFDYITDGAGGNGKAFGENDVTINDEYPGDEGNGGSDDDNDNVMNRNSNEREDGGLSDESGGSG